MTEQPKVEPHLALRYAIAKIPGHIIKPDPAFGFTEDTVKRFAFRIIVKAIKRSRLPRGHREMWTMIRDTAKDLGIDSNDLIDVKDSLYDDMRALRKNKKPRRKRRR